MAVIVLLYVALSHVSRIFSNVDVSFTLLFLLMARDKTSLTMHLAFFIPGMSLLQPTS